MNRFSLILICGFSGLIAVTGWTQSEITIQEQYVAAWSTREQEAASPPQRVQLAKDLYSAAQKAQSKTDKLYLCEKAFYWGRQDYPFGHEQAARALELMQRLQPDERLSCMEKLSELYYAAWKNNTRKYAPLGGSLSQKIETDIHSQDVEVGIDLARTKLEVAQQRLLNLLQEHREKGFASDVFMNELNICKRDCSRALTSARSVLSTARTYSHTHVWPETREMLKKFVEENDKMVGEIQKEQDKLNQLYDSYKQKGEEALPSHQRRGVARHIREARILYDQAEAERDAAEKKLRQAKAEAELADSETAKRQWLAQAEAARKAQAEADARLAEANKVLKIPPAVAFEDGPNLPQSIHFGEKVCTQCNQIFVPALGNSSSRCYWCDKGKKGFFGLSLN